jgi:hypothetical protein
MGISHNLIVCPKKIGGCRLKKMAMTLSGNGSSGKIEIIWKYFF